MSVGQLLRTDLIKTLSAFFLFALVMCVLGIAVYDKIAGVAVDSTVQAVLASAISVALANLGFNHGIATANGVAKDTAVAMVNAQQNEGSKAA